MSHPLFKRSGSTKPHSYNVNPLSAGIAGWRYVITGDRNAHVRTSDDAYSTPEDAIAAGEDYAQRLAEHMRRTLG